MRPSLWWVTILSLSSGCIPHLQPLMIQKWEGWENLQGTTFGADCVSIAANSIDCFAIGSGGITMRRHWNGTDWLPWTSAPGLPVEATYYSKPECISSSATRVDCFVRAQADNALYHRFWENDVVSGWEFLGGTLTSDPECVSANTGQIDCFMRGTTGALFRRHFDGNVWAPWENWGGQMAPDTKPGCASPGNGRIECVVTWIDEYPRHHGFGTALTAWSTPMGGAVRAVDDILKSPKCYASPAANRVDCVAPVLGNAQYSLTRYIFDGQNMSSMGLGSDYNSGVHARILKSYDWDCVERSNDRFDCMELVSWSPDVTLAANPPFLHQLSLGIDVPFVWVTPALTPIMYAQPISVDCVSSDGERIDCFSSGWPGGGAQWPLGHAAYVWQTPSVGGRLPPP